MQVDSNAMPVVVDWNGDGKKDLVIGEEKYPQVSGSIRLYLNNGTNSNPSFSTYSYINASGTPIYYYRANPAVCDLDQDGKKDLITGNNDGVVLFFRNVGTNNNPSFNNPPDTLKTTGGVVIDAYYGSRINFADWNGDGDFDLLISGYDGWMQYYESAGIVGAEEHKTAGPGLEAFTLSPNPSNGLVTLHYILEKTSRVEITVYTVDGAVAAVPFSGIQASGKHSLKCTLRDPSGAKLPAGVYFAKLSADERVRTARLIVVD